MRAFVTGGTGFIGSRVVKRLRDRGDDVVVLARSPEKASGLDAEVVQGDLGDAEAIRRGVKGCQAVFHIAADYRVGMPKAEREAMYDANVRGTERVLDAAAESGVDRIVYVSTVNAFGNTNGRTVDETFSREEADGFVSYYDETKYESHKLASERAAQGAPIVIVQPGLVYGPGDHAIVGELIDQASTGKMPAKAFPDLGYNAVFVDDVADGIVLAHDRGRVGESYVLGGEITTQGELIDKAAAIGGQKPPRMTVPPLVLKALSPFGRVVGPAMGLPPNMREMISAAHNVTYLARDDKARQELGYSPRDLETGLRETITAG
ncbi:MAG TPA: NAD-dependent epimerase/dehydratase family protein [Thermoleophilaceae bacterium]|jgi:nucleoside-diphosphate-sugar epimerase|nr:NAD-dependent epimerase/dehydratase family protein [Thermoleophilaceae bacterium]